MFVAPRGALLLRGVVTEFRTCLRRIGWNGPSPPESGHFPPVDAVPRVKPKNRMLARLNEAARTADAYACCASRLSFRLVCIHDADGVVFWAMLHIWNAHSRAL